MQSTDEIVNCLDTAPTQAVALTFNGSMYLDWSLESDHHLSMACVPKIDDSINRSWLFGNKKKCLEQ